MEFTAAADEATPVLIVGGGGAGLTASMLLARQGIEHLLVSARPETSVLPKAHVLNQRAMEVLEDVGVATAIAERGTPADQMAATAYYQALRVPMRTTAAVCCVSSPGAPAGRTSSGARRARAGR
jgi:2,4-dichlorophenol 6-monooxygenase